MTTAQDQVLLLTLLILVVLNDVTLDYLCLCCMNVAIFIYQFSFEYVQM